MTREIEKLRKKLDSLLEKRVDIDDDILEISRQLDELISSYYIEKLSLEKAI